MAKTVAKARLVTALERLRRGKNVQNRQLNKLLGEEGLTKLVNRLFGSHEKVLNPYDDDNANEALAEAREISAFKQVDLGAPRGYLLLLIAIKLNSNLRRQPTNDVVS